MTRLYALFALALLLGAPAMAQTGTAEFFVPVRGGEADGVPVTVYSEDPDAPVYTAVSDANGIATVEDVPAGMYYAFAAPEAGLVTLISTPAEVTAGASTPGFVIATEVDPSLGVVRGRLTDADTGAPLRLQLLVASEQGTAPVGVVSGFAAVDGDGNYAFLVQPGTYSLSYNVLTDDPEASYRPGDVGFTAASGETVVRDLALSRRVPGALAGTVTDAATGAPFAGAFVEVYSTDNTFYATATTGADGTYSVTVPENDYIVSVDSQLDGYLPAFFDGALFFEDATPVAVPGGGEASGVDLALVRPADDFAVTFTGRLVDSAGAPLENGTVSVYDARFPVTSTQDVRAMADGTFSVTLNEQTLAGSRLTLGFRAIGYEEEFYDDKPTAFVADYFTVGAEAATFDVGDVALRAEGEDAPGFAITGTVTDEETGAPLAGAVVAVTRVDAAAAPRFAATDDAGDYRVDGLDAGDYVVAFTAAEHVPEFYPDAQRWTAAERIAIAADRSGLNARMGGLNRPVGAQRKDGGNALTGVVRDAAGTPLAGAVVTARDETGTPVAYALTGPSGRYELAGLPGEVVTLSVDRPRFAPAVTASGSEGRLVLTLDALATTDAEGTPEASGADVGIYPNPARAQATVAYTLAEAGEVRVSVYDALGRRVAVVAEGAQAEGTYAAPVGTAALAPGLYVVRVETPSGAATARFTVVR